MELTPKAKKTSPSSPLHPVLGDSATQQDSACPAPTAWPRLLLETQADRSDRAADHTVMTLSLA